jgi:uncharacterized protein (DUF342 family)
LEARQNKLQEEVETMVEALKKIDAMLEESPRKDLQEKKMQLTRAKIDRDSKMNEIIKRKQETLEQMSKSHEAKVTIVKRVYPGTTITVNGSRVSVQDVIASVEYTRRGSGLVSYSLE